MLDTVKSFRMTQTANLDIFHQSLEEGACRASLLPEKFLLLFWHLNSLMAFWRSCFNRCGLSFYTQYLTTYMLRLPHKVIQVVIQGSGTHCFSLIPVSSQLVHTITTWIRGGWVRIPLLHVILPLVHGHTGVLIHSFGVCMWWDNTDWIVRRG